MERTVRGKCCSSIHLTSPLLSRNVIFGYLHNTQVTKKLGTVVLDYISWHLTDTYILRVRKISFWILKISHTKNLDLDKYLLFS